MRKKNTVDLIKKEIEKHVGKQVMVKDTGGRRKILIKNGIIEETYSSIFVVKLDDNTQRRITYTYTDVLTKTVQLVFAM